MHEHGQRLRYVPPCALKGFGLPHFLTDVLLNLGQCTRDKGAGRLQPKFADAMTTVEVSFNKGHESLN